MTGHSRGFARELHDYVRDRSHWKSIARWILVSLGVLVLIIWFGRHVIEEIEAVEHWIEGHGVIGWLTFVGLIVVLTSLLIPLSLPAMAGGAMFGVAGGITLTFLGAMLTASLNFMAARGWLRPRIDSWLDRHAKLRAIQKAAEGEGLRLQVLLRMAPINGVVVNYVLGTTNVRFLTYLIATVGLLPSVAVNVYLGYTATHVSKCAARVNDQSTAHTVATIAGLVVSIAVVVMVTRVAARAIANADVKPE